MEFLRFIAMVVCVRLYDDGAGGSGSWGRSVDKKSIGTFPASRARKRQIYVQLGEDVLISLS